MLGKQSAVQLGRLSIAALLEGGEEDPGCRIPKRTVPQFCRIATFEGRVGVSFVLKRQQHFSTLLDVVTSKTRRIHHGIRDGKHSSCDSRR